MTPQEAYLDQQRIFTSRLHHNHSERVLASTGEVKTAMHMDQPFLLVIFKESMTNMTHKPPALPSELNQLLQEFTDVFEKENPELPPV